MEHLHGLLCPHSIAQNFAQIMSIGSLLMTMVWDYFRRGQ